MHLRDKDDDVAEVGEEDLALRVEELRRRIAWQVSAAYGLPLDEPRTPAVLRPVLEPVPEPPPETVPGPKPDPRSDLPPAARQLPATKRRVPTLPELERLVALGAELNPERADEWRWYLFYLRNFARVDGTLSESFRLLIETAFGPLLPPCSAESLQVVA